MITKNKNSHASVVSKDTSLPTQSGRARLRSVFFLSSKIQGAILLFFCLFTPIAHANIDLNIISQIESSNRPNARGDFKNGVPQALGIFQLHQGVIDDWNKFHPHDLKTHSDALSPITAREIAKWYLTFRIPNMLRYIHKPVTTNSILTAWNMGIGSVKKGKVAHGYIAKYQRLEMESVRPSPHKTKISKRKYTCG